MSYEKLVRYLDNKTGGVFFEAGANDGIFQSYTYRLEKELDWTGVLVEPSLGAFDACKVNRPRSKVLNCALTDEDVETITGDFDGHPMSSVAGKRLSRAATVTVKAASLTDIFAEHLQGANVDLMSIDVENYELNVLRSLDYGRFRPRFILVEIYTASFYDVVNLLLSNDFLLIANITGFNKTDNPAWDGTHNDFLFRDLRPPRTAGA
jgi:FkbM family methyltransferase